MDIIIRGQRYREPLDTSDWREAKRMERERVQEIESRGDYRVLRNRKPPAGRALTPEEQETLFAMARTKNVKCRRLFPGVWRRIVQRLSSAFSWLLRYSRHVVYF